MDVVVEKLHRLKFIKRIMNIVNRKFQFRWKCVTKK